MQFEHGQCERFIAKQQVAEMCFCQRLRDEGVRKMKKKKKNTTASRFFSNFF